jgi:hypothetical protein
LNRRIFLATALLCAVFAAPARAQPGESPDDVRALLDKGRFTPQQSQAAVAMLDRAERRALPTAALTNRIREGIARHVEPKAILDVVQDRLADLERADDAVRECAQRGIAVRDRERSLLRLADAFTLGVKPGDVAVLIPAAAAGRGDLETVAHAAEVVGRLGRKGFTAGDTREIVAAAIAAAWTPERLDGIVGLLLEADALHLSLSDARELIVEGIREKKDGPALVAKLKRAAETDRRRPEPGMGRGERGRDE